MSEGWRRPHRLLLKSGVLALGVGLAACAGSRSVPASEDPDPSVGGLPVSRADLGKDWPLTVDSGTIDCLAPSAIIFTTPDGTVYGVNGTALTSGYPRIEPIWAKDPVVKGLNKINIGPLMDLGAARCGEA